VSQRITQNENHEKGCFRSFPPNDILKGGCFDPDGASDAPIEQKDHPSISLETLKFWAACFGNYSHSGKSCSLKYGTHCFDTAKAVATALTVLPPCVFGEPVFSPACWSCYVFSFAQTLTNGHGNALATLLAYAISPNMNTT
jgi:hypothetical protein